MVHFVSGQDDYDDEDDLERASDHNNSQIFEGGSSENSDDISVHSIGDGRKYLEESEQESNEPIKSKKR